MELLKIAINCRQNKRGELFRTCQSIAEQTFPEPGCTRSRVVRESNKKNVIRIEQQWKRWDDLNTYFNSNHFRALLGAMKLFGESYEIQINGCTQEVPSSATGIHDYETLVKSVS